MKNLMKMIIILTMISMHANSLMAQSNTTGIYLNAQDYKASKIAYANAANLKLNEFLGGNHISLISEGKKVRLAKAEIFGYRLNGIDFRFYHNEAYRVLDTAGFVLYSHAQLMPQGKGYLTVNKYFYSTAESASVNALTIANISKSFPDQTDFRYSLEHYFVGDADLAAYDKLNKQYAIKYLYFEYQHHAAAQHASL